MLRLSTPLNTESLDYKDRSIDIYQFQSTMNPGITKINGNEDKFVQIIKKLQSYDLHKLVDLHVM